MSILQITSQLFSPLYGQWLADTETLKSLETTESISSDHQTIAERWRFCLKALRRLVCYGFPSDSKSLVDVEAVGVVMPVLLHATQVGGKLSAYYPCTVAHVSPGFMASKKCDPHPTTTSNLNT